MTRGIELSQFVPLGRFLSFGKEISPSTSADIIIWEVIGFVPDARMAIAIFLKNWFLGIEIRYSVIEWRDICIKNKILSYDILRMGSMSEGSKNLLPR
jgi:hypothetical protein